ncbi:MAG TPA: LEPR-XLL domain-containing protein, partial [Verrucomicrobiae bacterium]
MAGRFELEQLESRVLLSADILAASASLASAVHSASEHKIFAVEHQTMASTGHTTGSPAGYNPADKVGGIFDGVHGEALTPAAADHHESISRTESKPAAAKPQPVAETPTTTASQQVQAQKQSATRTASTTTQPSAPTTISATATTGSTGSVHTQQLVKTLKAANAPPVKGPISQANPPVSTDFVTFVQQILAGQSGTYSGSPAVSGSLTVGNFLQLNGVTLTFSATETNSVWSGTVTVGATSGSVYSGQNFSATTGSISGTYIIGTVPQNSHAFSLTVNNLNLSIGQALTITASSFSFIYDAGSGVTQTVATVASATAKSPLFTGLPTATLTNFNLHPDGFSFDDFTLSSTSPITIGNFFKATGTTSFSVTQFNLKFDDAAHSTGSLEFTAGNIQLFPGISFLNLNFAGLHGSFDLIDTTTVNSVSTSVIGSGIFSLAISSFDISVGEAFTIHLGDVTINPGLATIASVGSASITSNLLSGFQAFPLGLFSLTPH